MHSWIVYEFCYKIKKNGMSKLTNHSVILKYKPSYKCRDLG